MEKTDGDRVSESMFVSSLPNDQERERESKGNESLFSKIHEKEDGEMETEKRDEHASDGL